MTIGTCTTGESKDPLLLAPQKERAVKLNACRTGNETRLMHAPKESSVTMQTQQEMTAAIDTCTTGERSDN